MSETVDEIKKELIKQGEVLAKAAVESTFALISKYIESTENKYDDAILPFLESAKAFVLEQCDKIDGE